MRIIRSHVWSGQAIGKPEWQYKEMSKATLFKDQLVCISRNGHCHLIDGDQDLLEDWLGGDDNLSGYYGDLGEPIEPGVYLADIQTWVYPGSYEYPEDTDVEFSMENVRELDLDVPQIPFQDFSAEVHINPPMFKLRGETGESYVTDKNEAPFHNMTRRPTGVRRRAKKKKYKGRTVGP